MKLPRRKFLHLAAGAAALPTPSLIAWAQTYPRRPVRIIVGFAAGGGADIAARLIGQWLSDRLGQSFVVENRPGAGSNIGTETVLNALPDGYTLLLATLSNVVNTTLYEKLNFRFTRDITPIAGIIRVPHVILVHPSVPAKTVPEFIAYAKANPGKVNMATGGNGSSGHMWQANCSVSWLASRWPTYLIAAKDQPLAICWAAKYRSCLPPRPAPLTISVPASCAHLP
jgi:tripartite-type tricarboxylate transporter receptor subunit TctC